MLHYRLCQVHRPAIYRFLRRFLFQLLSLRRTLPAAPLPTPPTRTRDNPETTLSGITEEKGYNELWAKRSEKPLQQIYGHIDRSATRKPGPCSIAMRIVLVMHSTAKSLLCGKLRSKKKSRKFETHPPWNCLMKNQKVSKASSSASKTNCAHSNRCIKKPKRWVIKKPLPTSHQPFKRLWHSERH